MIILGINPGWHDSSACIFDDYELIAAISSERITRVKGDGHRTIPEECIDEVLAVAGATRNDVDIIASTRGYLPSRFFPAYNTRQNNFKRSIRQILKKTEKSPSIYSEMKRSDKTDALDVVYPDKILREFRFRRDAKIVFCNHHFCHALPTLFYTHWNNALLYTADGGGDNVQYSVRSFRDERLETYFGDDNEMNNRIDSVGMAYGYCTQALGWRMNRHEGKLTGLAASGEPLLFEEFKKHFIVNERGEITSDFVDHRSMRRFFFNFAADIRKEDVAASIQALLEDIVLASVRIMLQRSNARHLGLSGGVFANVTLNRLLAEETDVSEVFIFPAMADDGLCVGACLNVLLQRDGMKSWLKNRHQLENLYLGRDYGNQIDELLTATPGIRRIQGNPATVAGSMILNGKIGAIYTKRMEFGPRALGARSILANPTDPSINDKLNNRLQRSEFMPFAPVILDNRAEEIFDVSTLNSYACRYMTITCAVKPEWRNRIRSVVHVDGTARPQIVRKECNPLYYDIIKDFENRTGIPVLINTSLNVHEEPIVNTPQECLKTLMDGSVDFIVTDNAAYTLLI